MIAMTDTKTLIIIAPILTLLSLFYPLRDRGLKYEKTIEEQKIFQCF